MPKNEHSLSQFWTLFHMLKMWFSNGKFGMESVPDTLYVVQPDKEV